MYLALEAATDDFRATVRMEREGERERGREGERERGRG